MHKSRISFLAADLWNHVFLILDDEPEISGMDAGHVATEVERIFTDSLRKINRDDDV